MHDLTNNLSLGVKMSLIKTMIHTQRLELIRQAITHNDFTTLQKMAREPGGFMKDSFRQYVWPILLRTHQGYYIDEKGSANDIADPIQISKDVERSLYYYPQDITPNLKARKQQELHRMIVEILWRNPRLKYYQGFHDICTVFLLVLGKRAGIPAAENVALFFTRDAMLDSFDPISKQLRLMMSIIEYEDTELMTFMERNNVMPFYALSWVLTWFSHDLTDFNKITRLFDLFIASSAMMPLYVASAITLIRRDELLGADPEYLHSLMTHIPEDIDIERTIQLACHLEANYSSLYLQKRSGIWLHDESTINTWEHDWDGKKVPDRLKADQYLANDVPVEEWEDELLTEWLTKRRCCLDDGTE
ncbi:rab-GTPase-TBC domain-containing protein [Halteromyces radiatus]|uniref:rab-GTPase-TBC domain-containing protein n=1 Tax=Halteromyces radiatus TaxID=101107 RepID=UPI00221FFF7F|nr:rab-GTPase-TBC domain-containing protein [Halteromyces radiatus]KAI8092502.1 rab-GTPase-TBC domain-containing protein [Halteromyces radiatus]